MMMLRESVSISLLSHNGAEGTEGALLELFVCNINWEGGDKKPLGLTALLQLLTWCMFSVVDLYQYD